VASLCFVDVVGYTYKYIQRVQLRGNVRGEQHSKRTAAARINNSVPDKLGKRFTVSIQSDVVDTAGCSQLGNNHLMHTVAHRVLAAGRLGDAAELGSTAQNLDSQAETLLSQAAGLRARAARARRAARQSRLKAEALGDWADLSAARLRHAQQAADVGAHAAQLLFLHCHVLLLAAELQADATHHRLQQAADSGWPDTR
jgi:hypothetical protein